MTEPSPGNKRQLRTATLTTMTPDKAKALARQAGKSTIALGGAVPLGRSAVSWLDDAGAGGVVEPSMKLEPV